MKFISKYSNYTIVLRSSEPAVPAIGKPSIKGLSVKFIDGNLLVDDKESETLKLLMSCSEYGTDFKEKDGGVDPYSDTRKSIEPEHNILEIDRGVIVKNVNPVKDNVSFNPKQKKILKDIISKEAKVMAKTMFKEMLKEQEKDKKEEKVESKEEEKVEVPETIFPNVSEENEVPVVDTKK